MIIVTCTAPVNIAIIKYWGKRDEKLILPINDSISVTLDTNVLCAKTTVAASPEFRKNRFWLNGREENFENPRLLGCLNEIRERARKNNDGKFEGNCDWKVHIYSENNFPTAAGLASSAAGFGCLVYALAKLFGVTGNISDIARLGSGSACRSVYGGFVRWHKGKEKDGSDSVATQIAPPNHWKELKILILIVESRTKSVGSTVGMQNSVKTSQLLKLRTEFCVPDRIQRCLDAIKKKDFEAFAEITMKDSNQFHAVCLDSYPPIKYLSEKSHAIINFIHALNDSFSETKAAYSFDAGENAFLFVSEKNVPLVLSLINYYFPPRLPSDDKYFRGSSVESVEPANLQDVIQSMNSVSPYPAGALQGIIYSDVGDGPVMLDESKHLLNENGLPK